MRFKKIVIGFVAFTMSVGLVADDADLAQAVKDLGSTEAAVREGAESTLAKAGDRGVKVINDICFPDVSQLIRDIEFGDFKARHRARKQFIWLGLPAERKLRERLKETDEPHLQAEGKRLLKALLENRDASRKVDQVAAACLFVLNHPGDSALCAPAHRFYFENYSGLTETLRKRLPEVVKSIKGKPGFENAIIEGVLNSTRSDLPVISQALVQAYPEQSLDLKELRFRRGLVKAESLDLSWLFNKRNPNLKSTSDRLKALQKTGDSYYKEIPAHIYALLCMEEVAANSLSLKIIEDELGHFGSRVTPLKPQIKRVIQRVSQTAETEGQMEFFRCLWGFPGWQDGLRPLANDFLESHNDYVFATGIRLIEKPSPAHVELMRSVLKSAFDHTHVKRISANVYSKEILKALAGRRDSRELFLDLAPSVANAPLERVAECGLEILGKDLRNHEKTVEKLILRGQSHSVFAQVDRWLPDRKKHFESVMEKAAVEEFGKSGLAAGLPYALYAWLEYRGRAFDDVWLKHWKKTVAPLKGTVDGAMAESAMLSQGMRLNVSTKVLLPYLREHEYSLLNMQSDLEGYLPKCTDEGFRGVATLYLDSFKKCLNGKVLPMFYFDRYDDQVIQLITQKTPDLVADAYLQQLRVEATSATKEPWWVRPVGRFTRYGFLALSRCPEKQNDLAALMVSPSISVKTLVAEALFRCGADKALFLDEIKKIPVEDLELHGPLESTIFVLLGCDEPAKTLIPYFERCFSLDSTQAHQVMEHPDWILCPDDRLFAALGPGHEALLPTLREQFRIDDEERGWIGLETVLNAILTIAPNDTETLAYLHAGVDFKDSDLLCLRLLCQFGHAPTLSESELRMVYTHCQSRFHRGLFERYRKEFVELNRERLLTDAQYSLHIDTFDADLLEDLGVDLHLEERSVEDQLRLLRFGNKSDRIMGTYLDVDALTPKQRLDFLSLYESEQSLDVVDEMNGTFADGKTSDAEIAELVRKRTSANMSREDKLSYWFALSRRTTDPVEKQAMIENIHTYAQSLGENEYEGFEDVMWTLFDRSPEEGARLWRNAWKTGQKEHSICYAADIVTSCNQITPEVIELYEEIAERYGIKGESGSLLPIEIVCELADNPELGIKVLPYLKRLKFEYRATKEYRNMLNAVRRYRKDMKQKPAN